MTERKGIVLAGGSGTRLWPITLGLSKQLLPIYDKPMIYYPISVLMMSGIRDIAIITTAEDQAQFQRLLRDGSQWGVHLSYIVQPSPDGLAQAYLLAKDFLAGAPSALVLGDNIFFGHGLPERLSAASVRYDGATIFAYRVADPQRYGVVDFDEDDNVRAIVEKPVLPPSRYAVTGLYFLDGEAPSLAAQIEPSARGELEITDLLELYRKRSRLRLEKLGRGFAWLDTGTYTSLLDAANFVRTLVERQGFQIGCPEEIAWRMKFISSGDLEDIARSFDRSEYGAYLRSLL